MQEKYGRIIDMLGIDLTYVHSSDKEYISGIALYAFETIRGFYELGYDNKIVLIVYPDDIDYFSKMFPKAQLISDPRFCMWGKFVRHINRNLFSHLKDILFRKAKITCVWYPYTCLSTNLSGSTNRMCTIHDLIPLDRSADSTNRDSYDRMLKGCQNIIAISEFTKSDIEHNFPKHHVSDVMYNPMYLKLDEVEQISELVGKKYILDLNGYSERKNAKTLILAYKKIMHQVDFDLVFCGADNIAGYFQALKQFAEEQQVCERVHFYRLLPTAQRNWLLLNTILMVSPTTSEGFGRSPIEAAICRKKVLTTRVDSLVEITDGLLNYYDDPYNVDELSEAILKLCNSGNDDEKELDYISHHFMEKYDPKSIAEKYYLYAEGLGAFDDC